QPLSQEVTAWCQSIFDRGGAILCGPGGDRFVYDLRRRFDLFCKIVPLRHYAALGNSGRIKPEYAKEVDILIIRENVAGVYQGQWKESFSADGGRTAEHTFSYAESTIRRLLKVAVGIARQRRGEITVVVKDSGVPSVSRLWRDCSTNEAERAGVKCSFMNLDHAAYSLVQHGQELDVIVAPNLAGDVIADVGAVLMGSRALPCSGNFSVAGAAVYQTNHGTGYDLVGKNLANPAAQILSLSMLLRESFGLIEEARLVEDALCEVWRQGWRTFDLMEPGYRQIGTREMGSLVAETLIELAAKSI
ncbi:MAG TPA: isocitrate/isopropylmalate family dehydrogenase, partial [Candidatus Obscuribacterales bacterium]